MQHLILGYGYCGYYLAKELAAQGQAVTTVSRHIAESMRLPQVNHLIQDITQPFSWTQKDTVAYYLIPPPNHGDKDSLLEQFLHQCSLQATKIIYFGSSGVYGNHQGAVVNEESVCHLKEARQYRRIDAEQQWRAFCNKQGSTPILLRIGGIYGPQRLPIEAAQAQAPIIETSQAPYINHIYVKDLALIASMLAQEAQPDSLYNVADGQPKPMGTVQQLVAQKLNSPAAPYQSWEEAWDKASVVKREFMHSSKRLNNDRLKQALGNSFSFTELGTAIDQCLNSYKRAN